MNIKQLHIETIIVGGIYLIWLSLITLIFLGKSPDIIFCYLSKVEPSTAVLLLTILFAVSFFLGRTVEHLLIALNFYRKNKRDKAKMVMLFMGNEGEIWGNKIFFISSFFGLLLILLYSHINK